MTTPDHGTYLRYRRGCRCSECTNACRVYNREKQSERSLRISEIPHGTMAGYESYMCRCRKCRDGYKAWRLARLSTFGPDQHGTRTAYSDGCRCSKCTTANTLRLRRKPVS